LRHLRVEQVNRYFAYAGTGDNEGGEEYLWGDANDNIAPQIDHRHYDEYAQELDIGTLMASNAAGVPGLRRRKSARLGISRVPFHEPIGSRREAFYEQKLLLGLAWYCSEAPLTNDDGSQCWRFVWKPPDDTGALLQPLCLVMGQDPVSFEHTCAQIESEFCSSEHDLVCECCSTRLGEVCSHCRFAVGFHWCHNPQNHKKDFMRWKKGTLFAGTLDIERCLFNLYRKGVPIEALKLKADEYVAADLLTIDMARHVCKAIEDERGHTTIVNEQADASAENGTEGGSVSSRLSAAALKKELEVREKNMQAGAEDGGLTDQWRVYQHVTHQLQSGEPIRLMVQASAGTGKSYLLSTIYLWCIVNGLNCEAAARPTSRLKGVVV
jgi:hypothetical protein